MDRLLFHRVLKKELGPELPVLPSFAPTQIGRSRTQRHLIYQQQRDLISDDEELEELIIGNLSDEGRLSENLQTLYQKKLSRWVERILVGEIKTRFRRL